MLRHHSPDAMHLVFSVEFLKDATETLDVSNYAGEIKAEELHKTIFITHAKIQQDYVHRSGLKPWRMIKMKLNKSDIN